MKILRGAGRHDGFGLGFELFPIGHHLLGAIVRLGLWSAWVEVSW